MISNESKIKPILNNSFAPDPIIKNKYRFHRKNFLCLRKYKNAFYSCEDLLKDYDELEEAIALNTYSFHNRKPSMIDTLCYVHTLYSDGQENSRIKKTPMDAHMIQMLWENTALLDKLRTILLCTIELSRRKIEKQQLNLHALQLMIYKKNAQMDALRKRLRKEGRDRSEIYRTIDNINDQLEHNLTISDDKPTANKRRQLRVESSSTDEQNVEKTDDQELNCKDLKQSKTRLETCKVIKAPPDSLNPNPDRVPKKDYVFSDDYYIKLHKSYQRDAEISRIKENEKILKGIKPPLPVRNRCLNCLKFKEVQSVTVVSDVTPLVNSAFLSKISLDTNQDVNNDTYITE